MYRKRFYATQLMKLFFQTLMYLTLFISFFGLLSVTNYAILNLSRTAVVTMATFNQHSPSEILTYEIRYGCCYERTGYK